ncbi:MAG: lipoprotein [Chloroflexi bacterium]|nr:lipoprotein [Chloroflexota bacterium]
MKRYNGFIFLLLVFMLASCSIINQQPDPVLAPITTHLTTYVGSEFGPDAAIEIAKNCFSLNEPIAIHLTLQAGTRDLDIRTSRLFVEGPLESGSSPNLSQIDWEPDGLPPLIKVG